MRKGRKLIGMPVVVTHSHREIERVEGLVLDLTETHVSALLVDSDDWSRQARVVALHDVESFGETEIGIGSPNVIHSVDQVPDIRGFLNMESTDVGAHLVTDEGVDVGTVNDLVFDEQTGGIEVFEVSREHTSRFDLNDAPLPLFDELDDEIIVHASKVRQMEEARPLARIKICSPEAGPRKDPFDIESNHWKMIGAKSSAGPNRCSLMPAGSNPGSAVRLWHRLKSKTYGFIQSILETIENRRIAQSIGHRIRRTVLGRDGFVLFEKGDIVTPSVVQRARQTCVLHDLLNAIDQSSIELIEIEEKKRTRGWMDEWWPPFI